MSGSIINLTIGLIILILTFSAFYFPIRIYQYLLKYREAALGLIFTKLDRSIRAFNIFAVAVLIFAIARLIDVGLYFSFSTSVNNLSTLMYLTTDILLIYSFYKLLSIVKIEDLNDT